MKMISPEPEGFGAISRWSSAATPPDIKRRECRIPEGCQSWRRATSREAVQHYIDSQEEHHRVKSFRDEFIEMLDKAGIEYDPKYLD